MMLQGHESGYTAPSAMNLKGRAGHAHDGSCLCSHGLAGTDDAANPHSGAVVLEPEGMNLWPASSTKTYVRFCNMTPLPHTVLRSPAMATDGRPLDAGSDDPVEDVAYELVRLATPVAKAGGVVGQGLQDGKFEPVWALIRKPGAKAPLDTFDGNGWALLYLRVRADDGQPPLADFRDGLPYKTVDIAFGEVSTKSSVKPDSKFCDVNRTLLAVLEEKATKAGTAPAAPTGKDAAKTTPQKASSGALLAISAVAGLYLLTKR